MQSPESALPTPSPYLAKPLKDVTVGELCVVLDNVSFGGLVDAFKLFGVSGRMLSRMKSHQTMVDIAKGQIHELVAETFFEDYVLEWQQAGGVPRDLLQSATSPTSDLKVVRSYCTITTTTNR